MLFAAPSAQAKLVKVNSIAAIVNGRVVTTNEVAFMLAPQRAMLAQKYPRMGDAFHKALRIERRNILNELINRQLILHEFKAMGAHIPDHAIKQEIQYQISTLYGGNEAKFRKQLKESGLSYQKFFDLTREKLIGQAMRAQHFNDVTPATSAELAREYNKIKSDIRDRSKDKINFEKIYILRENTDDILATPESQLALAKQLITRIKKGEDFSKLAKEYSKDPYAENGGQVNNVSHGDLQPVIANVLFTEKVGNVLGPIPDSKGYHIIRVTKKIEGPSPPISKVREQLERVVQNKKSSERFDRYINRLRHKAIIKIK